MARVPPESLLAQAATPALARVRADGARVEFPGRRLFQHLVGHLFDADLTVASWCRACRIWKGAALQRVVTAIGTSLGRYLEELRVETAMRLLVLVGGEWPASDAGLLVGYEGEDAVRSAFERQTGLAHTAYRQQVRELAQQGRRPPDPAWIRTGWLARLATGELEPTEVLAVVAEIEAASGGPQGGVREPAGFGSREDYERWLMARWWPRLRQLSAPELVTRLAQGFEFETPALCELLWCQIGNLGSAAGQRGVELAELALTQAIRLGRHLGAPEHSQVMALAWAWLGHARQSVQGPAGAAPAFLLAELWLTRHPAPPAVAEEVRRLSSDLAVGVAEGDVVHLPAAGRGGVAVGVGIGPDVQPFPRDSFAKRVEPGGEGSPERAEARRGAGFRAGEDRGGDAGEQHGEAQADEEVRKAVARHGSSLRAGAAPATTAGAPGAEPEPSPPLHPNLKPALTLGGVPEHLVATKLELAVYRVRRDATRAPKGWRPIFEQLAERLFDPQLRVKTLRKAHQLARPPETRAFEEVFGCEPGEYLTQLRIETVQALLPIKSLTVGACAQRAGFASLGGFEETYKRLCDETPSETRARLDAAGKTLAPEPPADPGLPFRRLLTLQDSPEVIAAICRELRERSCAALRERADSIESWEQLVVDEWWEEVREQPTPGLGSLLEGRLETGAAVETLCRACREEGRADRQRGLELAEVAIETLVSLRSQVEPSRLLELEAKGFAELGNAYRLLNDFAAAEQAFAAAEQRLEMCPVTTPLPHADVLAMKATLYHDEGRLEEALTFACRAFQLAAGGPSGLQAAIFLRKGSLLFQLGRSSEGMADFQAALELPDMEREAYLAWLAVQNLAIASHKLGDDAAARSWLDRAEPIVRSLGQPRPICLRDWLVGLLAQNQGDLTQAELHLRRAHAGYERLEDVAHGGLISLDLAALYLRLERPAEAAQLAAEALPQLGSLGLTAEGIEALGLLRQALETQALENAVLEKVRASIARLVGAPELAPAAG